MINFTHFTHTLSSRESPQSSLTLGGVARHTQCIAMVTNWYFLDHPVSKLGGVARHTQCVAMVTNWAIVFFRPPHTLCASKLGAWLSMPQCQCELEKTTLNWGGWLGVHNALLWLLSGPPPCGDAIHGETKQKWCPACIACLVKL